MSDESLIGQILGHFRVEKKLGAGGMGEVYLAEDLNLKRKVALKLVPSDLAASSERLERFQREAEVLATLNHPNIVTIYSVEKAAEIRFLTMELVEGRSLEQMIPEEGMELGPFFDVAIPLAEALSSAHEKGITHRDLKPANVMLSDEGRVKVLDFGLAKLLEAEPAPMATQVPTEALTQEGVAVGTVPYMSPEQIEGKEVDHRTDIFSLGILLYEMASGQRPFAGDSSPALMSSILKDHPSSVTELRDDLPRHLGRILEQCLEKDRRDRIQTARDVYNQLRSLRREVDSGTAFTGTHVAVQTESAPVEVKAPPAEEKILGMPHWMLMTLAGMIFGLVTLWMTMGRDSQSDAESGAEPPVVSTADRTQATGVSEERKMIVVLPFENLGPAEQGYFADGMTEEITSRLASVGELGVISRTSAMQYKENRPPIDQIAEELGVGYVLEGTVRWAGAAEGAGRVRITTQLIEVEDDTHLWAENYDRVLDDIFQVQSDIAGEVIDQLGLTLLEPEREAITERPTDNLAAYQAYLRGTDVGSSYQDEMLLEATDLFRRAVELDPEFMAAWARLSRAGAARYHFGYDRSKGLRSAAREAAKRALELAPNAPEAHTAMGFFHYHVEKDYEPAIAAFDRALELQPDHEVALEGKGLVLRRIMRWDESIDLHERAMRINPRDASLAFDLGDSYQSVREYERADALFERSIELDSEYVYSYFYRAFNLWLWKGDLVESRSVLETMPDTGSPDAYWSWWIQEIQEGDWEAALGWVNRFPEGPATLGARVRTRELLHGMTYLLMGDLAQARSHLEEAQAYLATAVGERQDGFRYRSALGIALAGLGREEDAVREGLRALDEYPVSRDSAWGPDLLEDMAFIYTLVGDQESAIARLDDWLSMPSKGSVARLEVDPRWDPLREYPAYRELLQKHGD